MNFDAFKTHVAAYAKDAGLTAYELYYKKGVDQSFNAFQGEIDRFSSSNGDGVCFRCIVNGKTGYASTELFSEEEAKRLVHDAKECAQVLENDDEEFIYDGKDTYRSSKPIREELDPAAVHMQTALKLEKACYEADSRVKTVSNSMVIESVSETHLVNSYGLDLCHKQRLYGAYTVVGAGEPNDMHAGFAMAFAKEASEIDHDQIVAETVRNATGAIGAKSVPSGKYPIVFSNLQMAAMLDTFSSIFSSEAAQKGLSLLAGKEGETIASETVSIIDNPELESSCCESPFDAEGVATYRKSVIENGVLKTLLYNLKTAHKAGISTTGNGYKPSYQAKVTVAPFAFYISPSEITFEDLLKQVENGLYITELNGMHAGADSVTGDFSLAASGYRIENGALGAPVKEITIGGNFFQLLKDIVAVGADLRFDMPMGNSQFGAPSVWVRELTVAGE